MRYWFDTEFTEITDPHPRIDLLSIGIVAEDGREYYAVNADADFRAAAEHPFVSEHVLPQLGGFESYRTRDELRTEVAAFLTSPVGTGPTELWAWYGAYDHVALAQLMGTMPEMPPHIPQWTNDLKQEAHRRRAARLPIQSTGLHNALEDARHLRYRHQVLETT